MDPKENFICNGLVMPSHRRVRIARGPCSICIGTTYLASNRKQPCYLLDFKAPVMPNCRLQKWKQRYLQGWLSTESPSLFNAIPKKRATAPDLPLPPQMHCLNSGTGL